MGSPGNSKNIKNDYIFVAIKGAQFDGSDFINEAKDKMVPSLLLQIILKIKL